MAHHFSCCLPLLLVLGCGQQQSADNSQFIPGFAPTPVQDGFTRYVLPPVLAIPPGSDILKCQWISPPADHDMYVTVVTGQQTTGGHHIVLYSNTRAEPVGTTRDCSGDDTLSIGYLGVYGGEGVGTGDGQLPLGVGFKLLKGQSLMANTHYINATQAPVDGQGVIDVQFVEASQVKQVSNLFANIAFNFSVPPGQSGSAEARCTFPTDISFFRMTNHVHEWGKSVYTEVIRGTSGAHEALVSNDTWTKELTFNFPFRLWSIEQPMTIHKGDTLVTHCNYNNTTPRALSFPTEMCVAFGLYVPGDGAQIHCDDGQWMDGK